MSIDHFVQVYGTTICIMTLCLLLVHKQHSPRVQYHSFFLSVGQVTPLHTQL